MCHLTQQGWGLYVAVKAGEDKQRSTFLADKAPFPLAHGRLLAEFIPLSLSQIMQQHTFSNYQYKSIANGLDDKWPNLPCAHAHKSVDTKHSTERTNCCQRVTQRDFTGVSHKAVKTACSHRAGPVNPILISMILATQRTWVSKKSRRSSQGKLLPHEEPLWNQLI